MMIKFHPLDRWIAARKQTLSAFSKASGIPFRQLYEHTDPGKPTNPTLAHMLAVEDATGRAVSVQAQADWIRAKNKRLAP